MKKDMIISRGDVNELIILRYYLKSLSTNVPGLDSESIQRELIDMLSILNVIIQNIEQRSL
nr:MAG: hypothetical protein [Microvirus sp.]